MSAFPEVVPAMVSDYSQINALDAQVYMQTPGVPQMNPAAAGDHHKLHCWYLKRASMKLIGAFK